MCVLLFISLLPSGLSSPPVPCLILLPDLTGVWRLALVDRLLGIFFRLAFVGFLPGHPESHSYVAFFGPSCMHFTCTRTRDAMANVEDIPFIVEDRRMLSRVAGDRSKFWGFGGLPC